MGLLEYCRLRDAAWDHAQLVAHVAQLGAAERKTLLGPIEIVTGASSCNFSVPARSGEKQPHYFPLYFIVLR